MKFIITLFLFTFSLIASANDCTSMVFRGKFPVAKEPVVILCHQRYVVGYSISRKAPLWTAEKLTANQLKSNKSFRLNAFRYNPQLPVNQQPQIGDFVGNEYDRGHMVNFEDLADDAWAASEGFYMTNMIAQHYQNNRGIWKALENRARYLAETRQEVYIVTGAIFEDTRRLSAGTSIPTKLFKMILAPSTKEAFTVVIPNAPFESSTLPSFMVTINDLQKMNRHVNVFPTRYQFLNQKALK